jgi:hypothetical protein
MNYGDITNAALEDDLWRVHLSQFPPSALYLGRWEVTESGTVWLRTVIPVNASNLKLLVTIGTNQARVAEFVALRDRGLPLPPIVVEVHSDGGNVVTDGGHRLTAARTHNDSDIAADVTERLGAPTDPRVLLTHKHVVEEALRRGLAVPTPVRQHYKL